MTSAIRSGETHRAWSASGCARRLAGVSMTLGSTALQRIASSRYSTATAWANAMTAAFEAMYPAAPENGCSAARDDTQTIAAPGRRWGRAAWVTR